MSLGYIFVTIIFDFFWVEDGCGYIINNIYQMYGCKQRLTKSTIWINLSQNCLKFLPKIFVFVTSTYRGLEELIPWQIRQGYTTNNKIIDIEIQEHKHVDYLTCHKKWNVWTKQRWRSNVHKWKVWSDTCVLCCWYTQIVFVCLCKHGSPIHV